MNTASNALSEAVLRRLTNDAVTTFLGESARYEAAAGPGLQLAFDVRSNSDPVATLELRV